MANGHNYPNSGSPSRDVAGRSDDLKTAYGGKATAGVTEFHPLLYNFGFQSLGFAGNAYYLACAWLSGYKHHGLKALTWWCLYDYNGFFPVGIFSGNDSGAPTRPTLAAYVARAICNICKDTSGATRTSFQPGMLAFSISPSLPAGYNAWSGGQTLLCQSASSGQYVLFIWNEQDNPGGATPTYTVSFGGVRTRVREYQITATPTTSLSALQDRSSVASIAITLGAEVKALLIDY